MKTGKLKTWDCMDKPKKNLMWAAKRIDELESAIVDIKAVLAAYYNKDTSDEVALDDILIIVSNLKESE